MDRNFIIGITGGTGAGKTRIVRELTERLKGKLTVFTQDNYYRPRETQPLDEKGIKNFDTLESLDSIKMEEDLRLLSKGVGFKQKVYHFNSPDATATWIDVEPAPLIIVEGLYALCYPSIFSMIDLSIFIEASEEVMLQRRIDRDFIERGYDQEDVRYRFANHFLPSYRTYVLPIREKASIVIGNNGHFNETMDLLEKSIITKIDFLR